MACFLTLNVFSLHCFLSSGCLLLQGPACVFIASYEYATHTMHKSFLMVRIEAKERGSPQTHMHLDKSQRNEKKKGSGKVFVVDVVVITVFQ